MAEKMTTYAVQEGIVSVSHGGKTYKVMKSGKVKLPAGAVWVEDLKATNQIFPENMAVQKQAELPLKRAK